MLFGSGKAINTICTRPSEGKTAEIAVGDDSEVVQVVLDASHAGSKLLQDYERKCRSAVASKDGNYFVTGQIEESDTSSKSWLTLNKVGAANTTESAEQWSQVAEPYPVEGKIFAVAIGGQDESLIAVGTQEGKLLLFNRTASGLKFLSDKINTKHQIMSIAIHPSGNWLLCAYGNGEMERWYEIQTDSPKNSGAKFLPLKKNELEVQEWDLTKSEVANSVYSMEFSRSGSKLVTGDQSSRVLIWDVSPAGLSHPEVVAAWGCQVDSVAFSHSEKRVLVGLRDGRIAIRSLPAIRLGSPLKQISDYMEDRFHLPVWEHQDTSKERIVGLGTWSSSQAGSMADESLWYVTGKGKVMKRTCEK
jgi:WD40 repeat protein